MDSIAKEAREALETSYDFDKDNRELMVEDLKFAAGFQWSDAAKAERAGRPMITINRSSQFLRQVSNPIRQNMPTIKVEPDRDDQSDMAEIANGLFRRIQYNSSAGHVYASAVEHMVACGLGWFRIVHDYVDQEGFDQEILIKRVFNPLSVYPDPASLDPARETMGWCVVSEMLPLEHFKKLYPKAKADGVDANMQTGKFATISWGSGDQIRIAEYWKREPVKKTIALLQDGSTHEVTEKGMAQVRDLIQQGVIVNTREVMGHKVTMTKVSGAEQLEDPYECPSRWIPLIPVVGTEIPLDKGLYRHGLLRFQREPQQLHNYFMSVAAESLGQQPKSPYMVTKKMVENWKSVWDNANKTPTPYLPYDPDPAQPGGPQRVAPPPLPTGLIQMAQMLADDMKATTGIYDASLGARSNETSGVAIAAREEQGNQATAHFVDNLEHSLEHAGRVMLDMMPKVYDTNRVLRLVGDDDAEKSVEINKPLLQVGDVEFKHNDMAGMKFQSVRVVLGPNYASRRAEAVQQLTALMQAMPQIGTIGGDLVVKNMDFDGSEELAERLRAVLPPEVVQATSGEDAPPPQPDPMAEAQAQGALRMMEAQSAEAEAKAQEAQAKAASAHQGIEVDARQALASLEGTYLDNELKRKKLSEPPPQANRPNAGTEARS